MDDHPYMQIYSLLRLCFSSRYRFQESRRMNGEHFIAENHGQRVFSQTADL